MKRIFSIILVLLIIFALSVVAYADESPSPSPTDDGGGHSSGGGFGRREWLDENEPEWPDDEQYQQSLDDAVTTVVSDTGFFLPAVVNYCYSSQSVFEWTISGSITWTFSVNAPSYNPTYSHLLSGPDVVAPVDGVYTFDLSNFTGSNMTLRKASEVLSGNFINGSYLTQNGGDFYIWADASVWGISYVNATVGWWVVPTSWDINNPPDGILPYVDRIGTISGDVVVIGDDNEVTVYNDCQFVDETNNRYYNPTTNNWYTYNNYSYDFRTLIYSFTTDTGDTIINYGDEYVSVTETINNVTNVYNYYYCIDDGSGDDEEPTEVLGWLELIYNKLVEIGESVFGIESQLSEDEDNETFINNFMLKFAWVDSVREIGNTFVTDITMDQGIGDGTSTPSRSTAPEIIINLGLAESHYGYGYGGEVKVLDLRNR